MLLTFNSFGDIVTAADLALRIFKALNDSTGSSFEYQCLLAELNALVHVLTLIDFAVRATPLRADVIEGVHAECARARVVLDKLWERIRGYQRSLGGGRTGGSSWRKIGWGLFKTNDIVGLRTQLAAHRETISNYLMASVLGTVNQVADEIRQSQMSIKVSVNQVLTTLRQPPRYVSADVDSLTSVTVAGESSADTPKQLCFSWEQLDPTLKPRFEVDHIGKQDYHGAYDVW